MPVKRTQSQRTRKAARTSKKRTATDAFGVGKGFALSSDHRILTKTSSVVMRYADSVTLNPGISGIPATVVLRANGMLTLMLVSVDTNPKDLTSLWQCMNTTTLTNVSSRYGQTPRI